MARKQVEIFDKATFETALPKLKGTDKPAWECVGLVGGEYTYLVTLGDTRPARILVRSSVDSTGWSRATGEDSIRVYVVDKDLKPLSGKANRWTTRLPGWQDRIRDVGSSLAGKISATLSGRPSGIMTTIRLIMVCLSALVARARPFVSS